MWHKAVRAREFALLASALLLYGCATAPTAPADDQQTLRFAFGGDLAGQNVCRDKVLGFPLFAQVLARKPDFFVALGDMIYADSLCEPLGRYGNPQLPRATGIAVSAEDFIAHWDYVRDDPGFAALLGAMPYYAVWDDHEVRNDFSPARAAVGSDEADIDLLIARSRSVFARLHEAGDDVLYFKRRFDPHLELFFLDTRSYRDDKALHDDQPLPKTMLGVQQRDWLLSAVTESTATWKIIVSSVPLSIPTGWPPNAGRDGWASGESRGGYERELGVIFEHFAEQGVRNLVVISADVHFATGFRYQPYPAFPDFEFYELVTGPLNAGLFPSRELDLSLRPERLFFHGPESPEAVTDFKTAVGWFNFGLIDISALGQLQFLLLDGYGQQRAALSLSPR